MKNVFYLISIAILVALQMTFQSFINIAPNLVLVFVTYIASFEKNKVNVICLSAIAGLMLDISQSGAIGVNAIIFMAIALFVSSMSANFSTYFGISIFLVFISEIIYNVLYFISTKIYLGNNDLRYIFFNVTMKEMVATVIFGIPVIYLFRKTHEIFRKISV